MERLSGVGAIRVPKTGNPVNMTEWVRPQLVPAFARDGEDEIEFVHVWAMDTFEAWEVGARVFAEFDRRAKHGADE